MPLWLLSAVNTEVCPITLISQTLPSPFRLALLLSASLMLARYESILGLAVLIWPMLSDLKDDSRTSD